MTDVYIYSLLKAWGQFRREGWNPGIGYDKVNILAQVPGGEVEEIPDDVVKVDKCIETLPSELKQPLRQTYEKRRSLRQGAKRLAISKSKFNNLLRQAEQRVTGYMSVENVRNKT